MKILVNSFDDCGVTSNEYLNVPLQQVLDGVNVTEYIEDRIMSEDEYEGDEASSQSEGELETDDYLKGYSTESNEERENDHDDEDDDEDDEE